MSRAILAAVAAVLLGGCASTPAPRVPTVHLPGTDQASHAVPDGRVVVLVFYSPNCKYLDAHEERLRALVDAYGPRGVEFLLVDSETSGTIERDRDEARARRYPLPIVRDSGGRLARAVGAEYALHTVVVGPDGRVLYRGAMDGDRLRMHDDAPMYLRDALDDVLAGRGPRAAAADAPGCALQLW